MWFIGLFGCGDGDVGGGVAPDFGGDVIFGPSLSIHQGKVSVHTFGHAKKLASLTGK